MEKFIFYAVIFSGFHKALHLGCWSSPRSAYEYSGLIRNNKASLKPNLSTIGKKVKKFKLLQYCVFL